MPQDASAGRVENRRQEEQVEEEETCQEVMPAIRAGEDNSGDRDGTDGRQREVAGC